MASVAFQNQTNLALLLLLLPVWLTNSVHRHLLSSSDKNRARRAVKLLGNRSPSALSGATNVQA